MTRFIAKAPAKINLGLFLGPVRPDGLHEIVTVTESLSLFDDVTLLPSTSNKDEILCRGVDGENLALDALRQFRERFDWDGEPLRLEIEKRVPVAAGMGGGSADAAAALRLCALASELDPNEEELLALAFGLGSDVPSQLHPGIALVQDGGGAVENFSPIQEHGVLVAPLSETLSTREVFKEADRLGIVRSEQELEGLVESLRTTLAAGQLPSEELLHNDLQRAAISLCPAIADALTAVAEVGATHAFVSGSGPTVVGLFNGPAGVDSAGAAAFELRDRFPDAIGVVPVSTDYAAAREQGGLCR